MHLRFINFVNILTFFVGKLALLDIGNNSITAKGAFHVAEFVKRTKSLVLLNLYMNDIGDEVTGVTSKIAPRIEFLTSFKYSVKLLNTKQKSISNTPPQLANTRIKALSKNLLRENINDLLA